MPFLRKYDPLPLVHEGSLPLTILFIHGLESGPTNSKAMKLRRCGYTVVAKDMNLRKRYPRQVGAGLSLILYVVGVLSGTIYFASGMQSTLAACTVAFASVAVGGALGYLAVRAFLRHVVESAIEAQAEMIRVYQPDVIVGYSFGGAITTMLIDRGLWNGRTVLLAPAYHRVCRGAEITPVPTLKPQHRVVIVQGRDDDVVELVDTQRLAHVIEGATLEVRPEGHKLPSLMEQDLTRLVEESVKTVAPAGDCAAFAEGDN